MICRRSGLRPCTGPIRLGWPAIRSTMMRQKLVTFAECFIVVSHHWMICHRNWCLKSRRITWSSLRPPDIITRAAVVVVESCRYSSNVRTVETFLQLNWKTFYHQKSEFRWSTALATRSHTAVIVDNVATTLRCMLIMPNHVQTSQHDDDEMMTLWRFPQFNRWFKIIRSNARLTWNDENCHCPPWWNDEKIKRVTVAAN